MRNKLITASLIFLLTGVLFAGSRRYTVSDIANPDYAEDNSYAIMEDLYDLWLEKLDRSPVASSLPTFTIKDLDDESMAEDNAYGIVQDVDDLRYFKLDNSTGVRTYTIEDLSNPDRSEENSNAINLMFDELWRDLADK